ncbi:MAG: insulinase family protein [Alphaproteobacteria bacterium HGW-Alphaproteobacteria-18]|nr:MAG: insulinase family protein [Alphaproteobacteria bacterium HGW-Alphaproteobacteria-18]
MKRILVAVGLLAFAVTGASAEPASATNPPSTFQLDNGMQVVVVPDHRAPVVTHMVWYKVGAVDEAPGKSGIAHLFEHVMFKETKNIGPEEFTSIVQRSGGQLNAFTSWDYTAYFERVHKDQLGKMMELEAERMVNLIINDDPKGPFISERDVVKEERRQRIDNNPGALLQEMVLSEFWKGHPYEITVIGLMDEVNALTPQDGLDFYREYYSPENAILVVAGDVTEEEVRTLAQVHYAPIQPTGQAHAGRKWQPVAPLAETKLITHADPKVRQPVWSRYYMGTSFSRDRETALALEVGLEVLGGGTTSRLYQALVEQQKLAINVATFAWTTLHDEGPAVIYGTPVSGLSLEALDEAVMAEIEKVLAEGFTEDEVRRARNKLAASAIYQTDSQSSMANHYGANLVLGFTLEEIARYPEEVRQVSAEEALAAVRAVFGADRNYITSHLLPAEGDF